MSLREFEMVRPGTLQEAVRVLADSGTGAMVIAGGTDVVPNLQMRLFSPRVVVDSRGWESCEESNIRSTAVCGLVPSPRSQI